MPVAHIQNEKVRNKPHSIRTARFGRTWHNATDFITLTNGEATFINHTFMVILSDKADISNVDANACAPEANWCSHVHWRALHSIARSELNINNNLDNNPAGIDEAEPWGHLIKLNQI